MDEKKPENEMIPKKGLKIRPKFERGRNIRKCPDLKLYRVKFSVFGKKVCSLFWKYFVKTLQSFTPKFILIKKVNLGDNCRPFESHLAFQKSV